MSRQAWSGILLVLCLLAINWVQDNRISDLESRISRLEQPAGDNR